MFFLGVGWGGCPFRKSHGAGLHCSHAVLFVEPMQWSRSCHAVLPDGHEASTCCRAHVDSSTCESSCLTDGLDRPVTLSFPMFFRIGSQLLELGNEVLVISLISRGKRYAARLFVRCSAVLEPLVLMQSRPTTAGTWACRTPPSFRSSVSCGRVIDLESQEDEDIAHVTTALKYFDFVSKNARWNL